MNPATHSRDELSKAKAALETMTAAESMDAFEESWKSFLKHVERAWNKLIAHYSRNPKWDNWKGKIEKFRKADPLLSYVTNARGAEEHTIEPIVKKTPSLFGLNPGPTGSAHIRSMFTDDNGKLFIDSDDDVVVTFIPAKVRLLEIVNRGRRYPPPTSHNGKTINPDEVLSLSAMVVDYYEDLLNRAEEHFCAKKI